MLAAPPDSAISGWSLVRPPISLCVCCSDCSLSWIGSVGDGAVAERPPCQARQLRSSNHHFRTPARIWLTNVAKGSIVLPFRCTGDWLSGGAIAHPQRSVHARGTVECDHDQGKRKNLATPLPVALLIHTERVWALGIAEFRRLGSDGTDWQPAVRQPSRART